MAVAREVVEAAGDDIKSQPVGTGPYGSRNGSEPRASSSRPIRSTAGSSSRRAAEPRHRALVESMRGKSLPQIGRIEISIIEESQAYLLAFQQGDLDYIELGGNDVATVLAGDALKPDLVKKGSVESASTRRGSFTYFNMKDTLVGGYSNAQVALRRAIAMGYNVDEMIKVLYAGQALAGKSVASTGVDGHDPSLPPKSLYDPAAARALLDRFGFKDRDGDGYRETPDGKPLVVVRGTLPGSWYREMDTLWKKNMDAIGIRMEVEQKTFSELSNLSRAGKLPMFNFGIRALEPSGYQILQILWGKSPIDTNFSQFSNADYDVAYEQFLRTPAGPARVALARKMSEISQALPADHGAHLRHRQHAALSLGAGLLAVAVRLLVEVPRPRRREAQGNGQIIGRGADRALRPGVRSRPEAPRRTSPGGARTAGRAVRAAFSNSRFFAASSICFSRRFSSLSRSFSGIAS